MMMGHMKHVVIIIAKENNLHKFKSYIIVLNTFL